MTDHDDERDDDQLRSLRAVWLSLPDEEPPQRGLAELMAAARIKAESMSRPSLWLRLAALLRRPPMLALATVMVLIGGAVIIGRRGDSMQSPSMRQDNHAAGPGAGSAAPTGEVPATPEAIESKPASNEPALAPPPPSEPVKQQRPRPRPAKELPPSPRTDTLDLGKKAKEPQASGGIGGARGGEGYAGDDAKDEVTSGAAPSREEEAPAKTTATPPRGQAPAQTSMSQYFSQARSAATRGDCAAARVLAGRIAKQDAQYYRDVVAKDATIHKCMTAATATE